MRLPSYFNLRLLTLNGLILSSLLFSTTSYAALSATTANTIEGTRPYFELTASGQPLMDIKELLGFSYKSGATTVLIDTNDSTQVAGGAHTISIPAGVYLDELEALIPIDGATHNLQGLTGLTIKDLDGDVTGGTFAKGILQATLKINNSVVTTALPHTQINVCGSYELEVKIANLTATHYPVTAYTTYGVPNDRIYTGAQTVATYQLLPQDKGLCYIKPKDMIDNWGYNASLWETGKGFNVANLDAAGKDFPTTGFKGAELTFIGSGINQALYKCDISGGTWASKGGANGCTLTYTSSGLPTAGDDITVTFKDAGTNAVIDIYTIKAPATGNWAEGDGANRVYTTGANFTGTFTAANYCSGATITTQAAASAYFFPRFKITNAAGKGGNFKRDADGTFLGEWGWVSSNTTIPAAIGGGTATGYTNSPWSAGDNYWAADSLTISQYYVNTYGRHNWAVTTHTGFASVCKR